MTTPHDLAMSLASEAQLLAMAGREVAAREKLESAAQHEQDAADAADVAGWRTRGILRISAVSLWLQAGRPDIGVTLATRYLEEPIAPAFARELDELRLECVRAARAASRLPTVSNDFVARAREHEAKLARLEPGAPIVEYKPAA